MQTISRRQFLGAGGAGAACLLAAARDAAAEPLGIPIGFQSYSVRNLLEKDWPGTLKELGQVGYKTVELCSPIGYKDAAFSQLLKMTPAEVKRMLADAGLKATSCHYQLREMNENLPECIEWAKAVGFNQMVVASMSIRPNSPMDAWRKAADDMNKAGAVTRKAGIQLAFHNHNMEFAKIDGVLIYDELLQRFDPEAVKMQFQTAVISIGYEAVPYFEKFPGRFCSLHLADWSSETRRMAPLGQGVIDWKKLFGAARKAGVKNYYVEVPLEALKASYPYLKNLKV
jgi:sugar phosphate isomerase/epimerase